MFAERQQSGQVAQAGVFRPTPRRPETLPASEAEHPFLDLQRNLGNQGVAQLMRSQSAGRDGASSKAGLIGTKALGDYLPLRGPLSGFGGVNIQQVAGLAGDHQTRAQARDGGIEMDAALSSAPAGEVRGLLAHETVHLAQQTGKGHPASPALLEAEARYLSANVLAGQPVWPVLSGNAGVALKAPPGKPNEPTVEELRAIDEAYKAAMRPARIKLDHLRAQLNYLKQLKKLMVERQPLETSRDVLDLSTGGNTRQRIAETMLMLLANRKPLWTHVMPPQEEFPGEIEIEAHFQAAFLGRKAADARPDFNKLQKSLETGVQKVWGQTLGAMPSLVKNYTFTVTPTAAQVEETAPRNDNFWLISVDPANKRAETHAEVNGGVMTIAPTDVDKPDTLGHESLHLIGLTDRYRDNLLTKHSESVRGTNTAGAGTGATRNDPLDTGKGPILHEDLDYLFVNLGTYEKVIMANMDPYDAALFKRLGRGRVPVLSDLLEAAGLEAANALAATGQTAQGGKAQQRADRDKTDPQKIAIQKINALIMQVSMDVDQEETRSHLRDLPDMAPPAQKPAHP